MEKLIELLNEYQKKLNWREGNKRNYEIYERELKDDNIRMNDLDDPYEGLNMYGGYAKARIISKQFGFIKRLVDNDKIEKEGGICPRKNLVQETIIEDRETHKAIGWENKYTEEEQLLMYLSIQDNPTEFLISVLK